MIKSFQIWLNKRLLTLSSFFGVILFYLLLADIPWIAIGDHWFKYPLKGAGLFLVFVLLSWLSLKYTLGHSITKSDKLQAKNVKPIESIAMPTYIGLFVISLEISDNTLDQAVSVLVILLILWSFLERVFYFNPIWLLFGYRFYDAYDNENNSYTIITRQANLKGAIEFENLHRVNEFTYIEGESNARNI